MVWGELGMGEEVERKGRGEEEEGREKEEGRTEGDEELVVVRVVEVFDEVGKGG